jgi:hypothetical protein
MVSTAPIAFAEEKRTKVNQDDYLEIHFQKRLFTPFFSIFIA